MRNSILSNSRKTLRTLKAIPLLGLILVLALIVVVVVNTALPMPVSAATAGPNNAGTGADDAAVGTAAWTDPGNITTVSAPDATITLSKTDGATNTSHYLRGTNYGFSIPLDATINGITVSVNRVDNSPKGCIDVGVYLLKAAGIVGSNHADTTNEWDTAMTVKPYGGAADMWGTTWTPAEINAADFGVSLNIRNTHPSQDRMATVNYMQITVTYTPAPNPVPTTTSISPTTKTYGDTGFTLTVNGTNFIASSVVNVDGNNRTTSYVNATQVTATIPASDLLTVGTKNITVFNPAPGGGTSGAQTWTVNKAPLTVTADNTSRVYGDANPAFTASYSGFKNGENLGSSGVTGSPNLTCGATPTSPVSGSPYTITTAVGSLASGNYSFSFVNGALTVNKATLTVTADNTSRVYGDANPAFTASYSGFKNGENLGSSGVTGSPSLTCGATPTSPVSGSPYTITAAVGTLSSGNYSFSFVDGDLTVTNATPGVSVTWASYTYDGTGHTATGFAYGVGGLGDVLSPAVTFSYVGTGATTYGPSAVAPSDAGTYEVTASFAGNANYDPASDTADITITAKELTITGITGVPKEYDGNISATVNYGSAALDGVVLGDNVTVDFSLASATFDNRNVGSGKTVTVNGLFLAGPDAGNYTLIAPTTTASITPRTASVTPDADSKVYGDPDPVFTGTLSSFLAGDNVTATYSRTPGETVLGSPYTISAILSPAGVLGNYTITYNTANFIITKKVASVTPDADSKVYGDPDPVFTGTLSGFLAGDNVTATYSRTPGETVLGSPYTISAILSPAGVLGNYTITYNTANFIITKKVASVTPDAKTKIYGSSDPALTGTLSGFLAGDSVTAAYSRISGETVAGSPYTISAILSPAGVLGNYTITYNTANFIITRKAASVTPDAKTKIYGSSDPALTGTLSGFLAGDSVTAAYSRISGETVAGSPYTISAVLSPAGVLGNYTITYNTANFTITPKAASVTPDAKTKIYGDADPALTGTLSGFLAGDSVTAAYSRTPGETVAGSPYTISAILSPAGVLGNYTITYNTANFTITPKALTITASNVPKTYGAAVTFAGTEFTASGLVGSDNVTSVTLTSAGAAAGATVAGSPYAIVASAATGTGLGNYTISYVDGALTVSPKALTITANNRTKIYGATVTFAGTEFAAGGMVNADTVTGVTLTSAGAAASAAVAGSPYSIVPSAAVGTGLGNYTISYVSGSLTLSKASIGLSMSSSLSTAVHGREVTFTASVTGTGATGTVTFKDGETILGSSTLSNGTATYSTSTLSAGTHSITAVYGGDANFAGNTSSDVPLTVKTPSGVNWALIGAIIAAIVLFGLFFFLLFKRRKKKPNQPPTIPTGART